MQLEDVHDVVSSLHSRRTKTDECFETKGKRVTFKCRVVMKRSLEVNEGFTAKGDSVFEGGNVFITNGKDSISEINGKGNLIVGGKSADVEANPGSHNVIIGLDNKYSAFGGLVAGFFNKISGDYASVTGGRNNIASGWSSSISGGYSNKASGFTSSISGGLNNEASGSWSSITGGNTNKASGFTSSITGGYRNKATDSYSSISGGLNNEASGPASSISGGLYNKATGSYSSVTGGTYNTAISDFENLP